MEIGICRWVLHHIKQLAANAQLTYMNQKLNKKTYHYRRPLSILSIHQVSLTARRNNSIT